MVVGHVETIEERIEHMIVIRDLQDETHGFRAFIPWTMSPNCTPRMKHLKQTGGEDYLKTVAISRLMLDNIEHLQSGWLTEGLKLGQIALAKDEIVSTFNLCKKSFYFIRIVLTVCVNSYHDIRFHF